LLLRDLGLTYRIEEEVLVVTTPAEAAKNPAARVYPVLELLPVNATSADALTQLVRTIVQRPVEAGLPPVVAHYGPLLVVRGTEETHREVENLLARLSAGVAASLPKPVPPGADPATP
jgi:hypothetical protein